MKDFFEGLVPKIQEAVIKDFQNIQEQVGSEKIYAAVLATDSDCITLGLWVNTIEQMEKRDIEYGYNDFDAYLKGLEQYNFSDEVMEEIKNGPPPTTKWMPDEWKYASTKAGGTVDISKLLYNKSKAIYDEAGDSMIDEIYDEFYKLFIESVTTAFHNLIKANAFGLAPEDITYFLYMTDDDRVNSIVKESAKLLNTAGVCEEFLRDSRF